MSDDKDPIKHTELEKKKGGFGFDNTNLKGKSPFSHVNVETTQLNMQSNCSFGLARYFGMTVGDD